MERVMGIEPTLAAWEAAVLPLNYTRAGREILRNPGASWQFSGVAGQTRMPGIGPNRSDSRTAPGWIPLRAPLPSRKMPHSCRGEHACKSSLVDGNGAIARERQSGTAAR